MELELEGLETFIEKRMQELRIPGLGIGIVKNGSVFYSRGFGHANIEKKEALSPNNVFRVASISKTFTAIGLMQQWEKGKFNLDDAINDYLPRGSISSKNPSVTPITFRHLLTHTSGIGEILKKSDLFRIPRFANKKQEKLFSLDKLYGRDITLGIPPGVKWSYANFGFNLLGHLLEVLSGTEFSEYMIKNIFNPLDMNDTDFAWSERVKPMQATGYKAKKGGFVESGTELQVLMPAGSLYTSINDMMKYMRCLLNGGMLDDAQILKPETLKLMITPHFRLDDRLQAIGLVFWSYNMGGIRILSHGGSINGYLSEMYLLPDENVGIIVCLNQNSMRDMSAIRIAHEILHRLIKLQVSKKELLAITPTISERELKSFEGRYGPSRGVLTNTRFYMSGGEIKIWIKDGDLTYKTMWGDKKGGVKLWQADSNDSSYYKIIDKLSYNCVEPHEKIIFRRDSTGNIISMYKGFNEYFKKPWHKTFKFKLYSRILFVCLGLLMIIILASSF